jgi:hypothetical protein
MAELQIERPKLIEAARRELQRIDVAEEIISQLQDVVDDQWRAIYDSRSRLKVILQHAGVPLPSDPGDYESGARRLVDGADRA